MHLNDQGIEFLTSAQTESMDLKQGWEINIAQNNQI